MIRTHRNEHTMTPLHTATPSTHPRPGRLLLAVGLTACGALLAGPLNADAAVRQASTAATVTNSAITEYATPTANAGPLGVAPGGDGRVWFAEQIADKIGAISTTGAITEYALRANSAPRMLTPFAGTPNRPAGTYFTANVLGSGYFGVMGLDGTLLTATDPVPGEAFVGAATESDGTTIWITSPTSDQLVRLGEAGSSNGYIIPMVGSTPEPVYIAAGPDNTIWFTNWRDQGFIGKRTSDGTITEYPLYPASGFSGSGRGFSGLGDAVSITAGPDGNMWFTLPNAKSVGRITPDGVITKFQVGVSAAGITAGNDGHLWFTTLPCSGGLAACADPAAFYADSPAQLGRITTGGTVSLYPVPTPTGGAWAITTGADGNLWFGETDASKIGTMSTSPITPPAPTAASGPSSAVVSVRANADGPAPTSYVVTASPGGKTCTVAAAAGSCTVRGLANDKNYTFTTVGVNTSPRPSAVSAASAPVKVGSLSLRLNSATGTTITTTFNAPGVGWAYQHGYTTQQGRTSASNQISICAMSKKVRKAGKTKLTCTLTKAARAARKRGTLTVSMVTTFIATGKAPVTSTTALTLRRR